MAPEEGFEGSQAELYLGLPDFGESELVHSVVPDRASILELGSGTGRITRSLLELGHAVTAVDNDPEMLSHVPIAAERILNDIETLTLAKSYPVVLLASNLINDPDRAVRSKLAACCRRHVSEEGIVLLQRYEPNLEGWEPGDWVDRGPLAVRVSHCERLGDQFNATIQYRRDGREWNHHFSAAILDDNELRAELSQVGLALERSVNLEETWVLARP